MASYPFVKMPTLDEFIQRVTSEFEVKIIEGDSTIRGPHREDGLRYFERVLDGTIYRVTVPVWPPGTIIQITKLRQLCYRLRLPIEKFGFVLDKDKGYMKNS